MARVAELVASSQAAMSTAAYEVADLLAIVGAAEQAASSGALSQGALWQLATTALVALAMSIVSILLLAPIDFRLRCVGL